MAVGLRPDPLGELERSPDSLAAKAGGLLLRGGEVREGNGIGWEGRGEDGRGGEGKGGERREGRREGGRGGVRIENYAL